MIRGIGLDTVSIQKTKKLLDLLGYSYTNSVFTKAENSNAIWQSNKEEYYATRFAAKEAVYKAIAPLTKSKTFDLRLVETLNHEDGSPYIHINEEMQIVLHEARVKQLFISITTEDDYASAFVIAT